MFKRYYILILPIVLLVAPLFLISQECYAQASYAGSETCKTCHPQEYDNVFKSGHPFKIQKVTGAPPIYPPGTSPGVPLPPVDLTNSWDDVSYVIGGFGWKARFMDTEGYILTGAADRQYNLANAELGLDSAWGGYSASTAPRKPYTCGSCHTTGWEETGEAGPHQDNLPGIYGTWAEAGVGCEGCHGPGSEHAGAPMDLAKRPTKDENCGSCHSRGDPLQIDVSSGLIRHHEQNEDLLASPHVGFACGSCHDPHKSTIYDMGGFKGQDATCVACHADIDIKVATNSHTECSSCHMPYAGKSAVNITVDYVGGSVKKGDIRTHIFAVNKDTTWNMFTDDGKWVRKDSTTGRAYITLDFSCMSCHNDKDMAWAAANAESIHGTGGPSLTANYIGSGNCQGCHPQKYTDVFNSGHPFKIQKVTGGPPTYPAGTSPGVPNPPVDLANGWNDVSYVIGGFGWKARFMDTEGYILTGAADRQYNLTNTVLGLDSSWGGYSASTAPRKPYTCGSCHTTGWEETGEAGPHQDNLPGIYGTWAEAGVGCEGCHGPGSEHQAAPMDLAKRPTKDENCGSCHSRGDPLQIDVSSGLIRHHEQYEGLLASPHNNFNCNRCHDPHKSTIYDLGGFKGEDLTCDLSGCHSDVEIKAGVAGHTECSSCHMPFAGKSAVNITVDYVGGSVKKGDIRTHIFAVEKDTTWKMFTDDGKWVRKDSTSGNAFITLDFACLSCHATKDMAWAAMNAEAIHGFPVSVPVATTDRIVPESYALHQNFPNPFNPSTTIIFDLRESGVVELKLYNLLGQEVSTLLNERLPAGQHKITFAANDLPSGVYIYRLAANNFAETKKMVFLK